MHFQRVPVLPHAPFQHIGEHTDRQFSILTSIHNFAIQQLVFKKTHIVLLIECQQAITLEDVEVLHHASNGILEGWCADGVIAIQTQPFRLKLITKPQPEVLIARRPRRFMHGVAVMLQGNMPIGLVVQTAVETCATQHAGAVGTL